jgi:hypothetical protein
VIQDFEGPIPDIQSTPCGAAEVRRHPGPQPTNAMKESPCSIS